MFTPVSGYTEERLFSSGFMQLWLRIIIYYQSLEFIVETRILAEMKIENRRKIFFHRKTN